MFFIGFLILFYPMPPRATFIGYIKPNVTPIQSDLLSSYIKVKGTSVLQPISQFRLRQGANEKGSRVRTDFVLIFFLKVQTGKKGFAITVSLLLRLRTLVYCTQSSLMKMLLITVENQPIYLLPYSQLIAIYFHTILILSKELTFPYKPVA